MKIALLVPCTSCKRDEWACIQDTYLWNLTLKTFLATCSPEHKYVLYVGHDMDDRLFANPIEQRKLGLFSKIYPFLTIRFVPLDAPKGYLTKMWNVLFKEAYDDGCDYFYQCGDDIYFVTPGWVNECIQVLQAHDNVGLAGPRNNNFIILTQAFVSREHMHIFGQFFPEELKNWGCDDWYNLVYEPDHLYVLTEHFCSNEGGLPRYKIDLGGVVQEEGFQQSLAMLRQKASNIAQLDKAKISAYLASVLHSS
jgi:hypothetical protein